MTNRKTAILTFTALLLSLPAGLRAAGADSARPNVVVFLVDDMGVMDTSVPFLTDEGGRPKPYPLNDFYAMSVCSPTGICLLTGQNAARHHTTNWINPDHNNRGPFGPPHWNWEGLKRDDVTLPRLLQRAGYRTIQVGKGHFGPRRADGAEPMNLGFDVNVAGCSIGAPASYYGKQNYGHGTRRSSCGVPGLEKYHGTDTFLTEALTIEAKSRLTDARKAGKPFFLYMARCAVHAASQRLLHLLPPRKLESHLPLLPFQGLRGLALPTLQPCRRPFRVAEPGGIQSRSAPRDDAGLDCEPGGT